ncbi:hypothetical protein TNCT_66481 [Trichonephila clavata]|uniref:Uncharacterized protein n=1 Tax=Trichonephila clavata TaxID=2740835 RepID=A0A8X6GMD6_TRICU|nr:hypothetical protein TNCT_66481 [Trichonephila clavata]
MEIQKLLAITRWSYIKEDNPADNASNLTGNRRSTHRPRESNKSEQKMSERFKDPNWSYFGPRGFIKLTKTIPSIQDLVGGEGLHNNNIHFKSISPY